MMKRKDNIVAYGEVTGHYHAIEGGGVEVSGEQNSSECTVVIPGTGKITHQEHRSITLPKDTYRTRIVKEYDPFEEYIRDVAD